MTIPAPMAAQRTFRWAVTGSGGFVGRALVAWLETHGQAVRRISRGRAQDMASDHACPVPSYQDVDALTAAFTECDIVVHLAALAHVIGGKAVPLENYRRANRDSARCVALAARAAGVQRMVLVSSIGVNGDRTPGKPFSDADMPAPAEPYAVTKWEGEQAVAGVLGDGATDFTVIRPTLVYGPGCPGNFRRLLKLVHGLPLVPLGSMRAPRSFVYVNNLCDALLHVGTHPCASRRTFLVADGQDTTVREIALQLLTTMGRSPARLISIPMPIMQALARLAGAGAALDKLAAPLRVDTSSLQRAIDWCAPISATEGLSATARAFVGGDGSA